MLTLATNLWDHTEVPTARFITTNGAVRYDGACVMGRGCARQAIERIPGINYTLGRKIKQAGNHVHQLDVYDGAPVYSFPVKHHWKDNADLELITRSAEEAMRELTLDRALLPRPGCGNGHLHWQQVHAVIADLLDDRFYVIDYTRS